MPFRPLLLAASLLYASALKKAQQLRYEHEQLSAGALIGVASGSGTFLVAGRFTKQWYPGGMAYRPLARPVFSVQQRLALAMGLALTSHLLTLEFAWRADSAGVTLRRLGALPLDAAAGVRARIQEAERRRERARRKQRIRENPRPARIMMPG
jgi:hypothetical protein